MFTESNFETAGLDRYCSWLVCGACGRKVFVGEPVGTFIDSLECHAQLHITRLEAPPARARVRPRIGLPIPALLALGTAIGFAGFLWANFRGAR